MSAAATLAPDGAARAARRARLRTDVTRAARVLSPAWPLATFVAVNPLGGLEDRPFGEALRIAGDVLGARGTLPEAAFRDAYAAGRVTREDLHAALARRAPAGLAAKPVTIAARRVGPLELLVADLLHGEPARPPARRLRTRAEQAAPALADDVDRRAAMWCAAFLDGGQAGWPMPDRERGFFPAWRALAPHDRSLPADVRARVRELPERAEDAALDALDALGIADTERRGYLQAHLGRQPGWAAHVRWCGEHGSGIDLLGLLAVRLVLERALLETHGTDAAGLPDPAAPPAPADPWQRAARVADVLGGTGALEEVAAILETLPVEERALVWLDAYERHYRDALLGALDRPAAPAPAAQPAAQLVCCIDTRSEGLRRHLEARGRYETLGFAGFFAVAVRVQDLAGGAPDASCPVLLEPRNEVRETPWTGAEALAERRLAGLRALAGAEDGFHAAKDDLASPFALAEASGWAAGPLGAARTVLARHYGSVREQLRRRAAPEAPTTLGVLDGFRFEERGLFAEVALTMMGLTGPFARLVVLCGHGSRTENNPYASALDCGACGGHPGGPNARVAADILNGPDVRLHLAQRGIRIPPDTWFVAAEHDTATDRVTVLDEHLVPQDHREELAALVADLADAGAALSAERCADLPGAPGAPSPAAAVRHVRTRAADWAQVVPEWGLAGNAALVVGPRAMTRGLDLGRRTFLHSYEASVDPEGAALETILTAPLVVAQWISCQYYFSSVEPERFGAGTKTIHNVVGGLGVLAGQGGDLRTGLPWQSVADGTRLVHEPMRLLAVVQAPLDRIGAIVDRNPVLQRLFGNGWVALAAREHPGDAWMRYTPGGFAPWTTPGATR